MTAPAAAMQTVTVDLGERVVEVEVRRSTRARTTRIQLGRDVPLCVIVPDGASDEYAQDAVRNKAAWVLGKLRLVEDARSRPSALGLTRSGTVWVHGAPVELSRADVRASRLCEGRLLVPTDDDGTATWRWYRNQARAWLVNLTYEEAARLGAEVHRVSVRDQRTRWGSCSRHAHISLSWRLFLAPEDVARYVVVHELVHLDVPNHSKAFWRRLAIVYPEWRGASDWLARHGYELREYDPAAALGLQSLTPRRRALRR